MTTKTKSQETAADVAALIRSRNPLIWVVTREEARVEGYLMEAAASAGYVPRTWDCAQGVAALNGTPESTIAGGDIGALLEAIRARSVAKRERGAWIMRDLQPWLDGAIGIQTRRQLRNLARVLPGAEPAGSQSMIVLSSTADVPADLAADATVIEWPMPDRAEIASLLDAAIAGLPEFATDPETKQPDPARPLRALAAPNGTRDAAIDAAVGLTGLEAQACYAKSLVQLRRVDPAAVAAEKKRVITRERVLEWFDPLPGGLDSVGGLENLKSWVVKRKLAYSPAARAYGLPSPKGLLLVGVPGCGKSLTSKAISTAFGGVPLLKLDLGALKSKFVGDSEANLRKVFRVVEALGRCVVWIDEIEKALQGATSGSADGGVSSDALGAVLSWMQERRGEAFVVATANDATSLPPELLRKGRFDEVFSIDLPTERERVEILSAALRSHGRPGAPENATVNVRLVASACADFTGSEIAALVPDALFAAFADGARDISTDDLLTAARAVVPLIKTAPEKIEALRDWAKTRARPASQPELQSTGSRAGRTIEL